MTHGICCQLQFHSVIIEITSILWNQKEFLFPQRRIPYNSGKFFFSGKSITKNNYLFIFLYHCYHCHYYYCHYYYYYYYYYFTTFFFNKQNFCDLSKQHILLIIKQILLIIKDGHVRQWELSAIIVLRAVDTQHRMKWPSVIMN